MKTCCVTGHREIPADKIEHVKNVLRSQVLQAVEDGYTHYVSGFAEGFRADRIYRVDMALLLLACYEIIFMKDSIPYKVTCNEIIELAKVYSTDKSPAYINGILAGVIKNVLSD